MRSVHALTRDFPPRPVIPPQGGPGEAKDPLCDGEIEQLVRLTNDGLTNDEIADIMGITRRQIQDTRRKIGIQSLVPRGKTRRGME